jgi:hypothetical protein
LRLDVLYGPLADDPFEPQPSANNKGTSAASDETLLRNLKGKAAEEDPGAPPGMDTTTPPLHENRSIRI